MPPASPTTPARKPRQVVDLELESVALTTSPSNEAAEIFIVRSKGGQMPETEELQRRVQALESEKAAKDAQLEELVRFKAQAEAKEERNLCAEIVRSVAPNVAVKGVDIADLVYRTRKAAAAGGDKTLEADLMAVLRAADASTKASAALTRTLGTSEADADASDLPAEVQRAIAPPQKPGVSLAVALARAASDAVKAGDNALYAALRNVKVS